MRTPRLFLLSCFAVAALVARAAHPDAIIIDGEVFRDITIFQTDTRYFFRAPDGRAVSVSKEDIGPGEVAFGDELLAIDQPPAEPAAAPAAEEPAEEEPADEAPRADGEPMMAEGEMPMAEGEPMLAEGEPMLAEGETAAAEGEPMLAEGGTPAAEGEIGRAHV